MPVGPILLEYCPNPDESSLEIFDVQRLRLDRLQ